MVGFKMILAYILCIFYSFSSILFLIFKLITKYKTRFWNVKERPIPPKCLSDPIYGRHKYIHVNGIKLHYVENGDSTKPLMIFVHGFPEFWYSWRYQITEFSKDYWVIALDMRGYGDSEKPTKISAYAIDNLTDDIKCLIKELGRDKCIIIGHDWGSVIGWKFVTKHMDLVDKYVMMGAPSIEVLANSITSDWTQFRMSWYVFYFQMRFLPEFMMKLNDLVGLKVIGNFKFSKVFTEEDLEAYKYTFSKKGALTHPINYYRANLNFDVKRNRPVLNEYAPGLYILGENDLYITKTSGEILQKWYKNLDFKIVKNANHFVQQDAPKMVNNLIRDFLQKN